MKILSQASHLCHVILILSNHNEIPRILGVCGKIFTSLSLDFCTENPYSKMFLTRTFLFVNRFSKLLLNILRQTKCSIVPENILCIFKQLQSICQKPLSDEKKLKVCLESSRNMYTCMCP